ncbi:MAG: BrxA/BrxB family bacilliredoxin [Bdellovibrionales bacterium]|nr:BrxA/BrxB family bacilliredoxin [Bdellovibrionales bacterium]
MYPEELVAPMRAELVEIGFKELRSASDVDQVAKQNNGDATLLVVNSVCGCSAGSARPGVAKALSHKKRPNNLVTVFAGQDSEATARAREMLMIGQPPSSPSMALIKDGKLVHMIHRHNIEGHSAEQVAEQLTSAFEKYC